LKRYAKKSVSDRLIGEGRQIKSLACVDIASVLQDISTAPMPIVHGLYPSVSVIASVASGFSTVCSVLRIGLTKTLKDLLNSFYCC
jgi:hypothetical protein